MNKSRNNSRQGNRKGKERRDERYDGDEAKRTSKSRKNRDERLDSKGCDNDPNWYFSDRMLADQVSQLSFQQIAGMETSVAGKNVPVANIFRILVNPSPGVQVHNGISADQKSAINQAGFKLWSMISAYTGRTATYGPQDISMMILYMGEVITVVEYLRRVFGCMFVWSERDRSYPKQIIQAMGIDPDDLMRNYSDYRTKFNSIVQRINQVPVPRGIAYFEKCASMFEKVYKDSPSGMASLLFLAPYTIWRLDETTDTRGTTLVTTTWLYQKNGAPTTYTTMGSFLIDLDGMVTDLLSSSTFNVVYTDLLNLATKMKLDFWKFDYLSEGYVVTPEYNENFLLQMHNMTAINSPKLTTEITANLMTVYNDVVSDPSNNRLLYNPGWAVAEGYHVQKCICDLTTDVPTVETRVESLRFTSLAGDGQVADSGGAVWQYGYALPDHYVVAFQLIDPSGTINSLRSFNGVTGASQSALENWMKALSKLSHVDWSPLWYGISKYFTDSLGHDWYAIDDSACIGDLNFWTLVDHEWIRKVADFVGIDLYSLR